MFAPTFWSAFLCPLFNVVRFGTSPGLEWNHLRSWIKNKEDGFIRVWNRRLQFAGKAAFRRVAASGNRGPTLKQPRCKLNLRDQRRTHCLSCFAVFQARGAEAVTKPSGAEGVTNSCAATAAVGGMPFVKF